MLLMKHIDSIIDKKKSNNLSDNWLNLETLRNHFFEHSFPNGSLEEWKNFNTNNITKNDWSLNFNTNVSKNKKSQIEYENCIVIKDGEYSKELSNYEDINGLKVLSLEDYAKNYPEKMNNIYNNPDKYSEKRISGLDDNRTSSLMSLNAILRKGIVILLEEETIIDKTIILYNYTEDNKTLISPYVYIMAGAGSSVKFTEISNYSNENWINPLYEIYLQKNSKIHFSLLCLNSFSSITTSSINFHLGKKSYVNLALISRENTKNDVRVFLKEENSKVDINGINLSSDDKEADVYCKVVHLAKNTKSNQNWRLISADKSKTSVNGKIRVDSGSIKSDAKFSSKSLLLDKKASSHSKPELEIFEGDISCSHGASFGEIDKDKVFYMQSRGISKKNAIKILLVSFINEINLPEGFIKRTIINEIDHFLERKL